MPHLRAVARPVRLLVAGSPVDVIGHDAIARRAHVALVGVILVVWLPRGQWVTLGVDLLVLVALEALRRQEQSLPTWRPNANTTGGELAATALWPALLD